MPHDPSTEPSAAPAARRTRGSRRRRAGVLSGRGGYVATAGAALLGLSLAAVSSATAADTERRGHGVVAGDTATDTAYDMRTRAEAAQRADRSGRSVPTPAAPRASAGPTAASTRTTPSASPSRAKAKPTPRAAWVHPMPGAEVTSCYGWRWGALHAGVDLALPENTPIRAAAAGTVVSAGWIQSGYGISVLVDHGNGYLTHYGHLNRAVVEAGEEVAAGERIGNEGSTGDSTGPHLHFEVHDGQWNQIDPAPWMRARGVDLAC